MRSTLNGFIQLFCFGLKILVRFALESLQRVIKQAFDFKQVVEW